MPSAQWVDLRRMKNLTKKKGERRKEKGEITVRVVLTSILLNPNFIILSSLLTTPRKAFLLSHFSFNPASRSFPPPQLGNSSKLKRVFFLVARQRLSKLIFTLTPASVDCTRFGVGSHFPKYAFPPHTPPSPNLLLEHVSAEHHRRRH